MAVATIVAVIGFSAIHVARLHLTATATKRDGYSARLMALSAIEHALAEFHTNPNWQSEYSVGVEYPATAPTIGGGTFAWKIVDAGVAGRRLEGIGRVGEARCALQVSLGDPGKWLQYGLLCGSDIKVGRNNKTSYLTVTGAPLCSNGTFSNDNRSDGGGDDDDDDDGGGSSGTVIADVEAQAIHGAVQGTRTAPAAKQILPTQDEVFAYYLAHGTPLGTTQIQKQLISPSSNPNGATNPHGIYVIDAGGGTVRISESRIVGTIVVVNASQVELREQICWEPARANFPALIVQGNICCRLVDGRLSEANEGVNFNPSGTPYGGATDSVRDDEYPQIIAGIVYCTGNLTVDGNNNRNSANFDGLVLVQGQCTVSKEADVRITYNSLHLSSPPPGFKPTQLNEIKRGTWRQVPVN